MPPGGTCCPSDHQHGPAQCQDCQSAEPVLLSVPSCHSLYSKKRQSCEAVRTSGDASYRLQQSIMSRQFRLTANLHAKTVPSHADQPARACMKPAEGDARLAVHTLSAMHSLLTFTELSATYLSVRFHGNDWKQEHLTTVVT